MHRTPLVLLAGTLTATLLAAAMPASAIALEVTVRDVVDPDARVELRWNVLHCLPLYCVMQATATHSSASGAYVMGYLEASGSPSDTCQAYGSCGTASALVIVPRGGCVSARAMTASFPGAGASGASTSATSCAPLAQA